MSGKSTWMIIIMIIIAELHYQILLISCGWFFLGTRLINAYTESKKYIKLHTNADLLLQKNKILSPRIWSMNIALSLFLFASSQHLNNLDATLTIPATKIKFAVYNNHSAGIKFSYPFGWEPILKKSSNSSMVIEILFPNIAGSSNPSGIHWHGPSTSFITLSIANMSSSYNSTLPS